jgi:hypothetical protein
MIMRNLRLMLSAKIPTTTGSPWGSFNHNLLTKTISNGHKTNLGNQTVKVTTQTGMARLAFFVKCKTHITRTAARGSRPISLAWTPADTSSDPKSAADSNNLTNSMEALDFTFQDFQ